MIGVTQRERIFGLMFSENIYKLPPFLGLVIGVTQRERIFVLMFSKNIHKLPPVPVTDTGK